MIVAVCLGPDGADGRGRAALALAAPLADVRVVVIAAAAGPAVDVTVTGLGDAATGDADGGVALGIVLAAAARAHGASVIVCGSGSTGPAALMGAAIARELAAPLLVRVETLTRASNAVEVTVRGGDGKRRLRVAPPVVLQPSSSVEPRPLPAPGAPLTVDWRDLGLEAWKVTGAAGPKVTVEPLRRKPAAISTLDDLVRRWRTITPGSSDR